VAHVEALTMRYALILAFAVGLAYGADPDPVEVLTRATWKVLATTRNIPNYTCVETVSRQYFRPAAATLPRACAALMEARRHRTLDLVLRRIATDRLRLDVAMTERGEIFSWVGASKFDDRSIDNVVRNGPMGTGLFGGTLSMIFESGVKFTFLGKTELNGRSFFEYSFHVNRPDSRYKVKAGNSWVPTAYGGTIRLDPETADLVGITVETDELPLATGECVSIMNLEFGSARIGDAQFLLPKLANQRFISPNGNEVENNTEFANCREYRGESTVIFEEAPPLAGNRPRSAPPKPPTVPAGTRLSFELTQPIAGDQAAAGDPFTGRLIQPLRDLRAKVLAPKGTVVEGHLLRVENFSKPPETVVVLRPEALRIKGSRVLLTAVPEWQRFALEARSKDRQRMMFNLPLVGEEHSGVFRFPGEHAIVPKGFQSDWRTVPGQ
jgi:hypothetical protein